MAKRLIIFAAVFEWALPALFGGECSDKFTAATLRGTRIDQYSERALVKQFGVPRERWKSKRTVELTYDNLGPVRGKYVVIIDLVKDRVSQVFVTPEEKDLDKLASAISGKVIRCRYVWHSCDNDKEDARVVESPRGTMVFVEIPSRGVTVFTSMDGQVGFFEMSAQSKHSDDPPCIAK